MIKKGPLTFVVLLFTLCCINFEECSNLLGIHHIEMEMSLWT